MRFFRRRLVEELQSNIGFSIALLRSRKLHFTERSWVAQIATVTTRNGILLPPPPAIDQQYLPRLRNIGIFAHIDAGKIETECNVGSRERLGVGNDGNKI